MNMNIVSFGRIFCDVVAQNSYLLKKVFMYVTPVFNFMNYYYYYYFIIPA